MPDNRMVTAAATDIITSRTKYHMQPRWTGTFKTSQLIPIYADSSIRPGDTVKLNISQVIRGINPVFPVMDDAYLSVECFFVRHKNVLSRTMMTPSVNDSNRSWAAWLGAQDSLLNMPLPDNTLKLPGMFVTQKSHTSAPYVVGSLADYFLMPPPKADANNTSRYKVNALKPLAYFSVWNNFFREPSTQTPVTFTISTVSGEANIVQFSGSDGVLSVHTDCLSSYSPAGVCRDHGYFGSALPWPQRNSDAITLPLGDVAPVVTGDVNDDDLLKGTPALKWADTTNGLASGSGGMLFYRIQSGEGKTTLTDNANGNFVKESITPANLWTDLSQATAATVNQVRYAFAAQRWFEQLARGGNRYSELVYSMTGVRQHDAADDRPEYLGGKRIPINQCQVAQTAPAAAGGTTGLGYLGAFSHTSDSDYYFTKSFDDYGTLIVVAFVRVKDTFHQGIARQDTVFDKFDIFWSQFANIGEVPIKNKEIFVQGNSYDDQVFGYQEAWADYRLKLDGVCGLVRPSESLGYLTYTNNFSQLPDLKTFLTGSQVANVDQTLATQSALAGYQWMAQFQFDIEFVRQIPMYSIPGYIDHH